MTRFAYHRSIGPMIGVLLGLAIVEMIVVHIVAMAWWGWRVALALGAVDLSVVAALVALLRSFRTRPITIDDGVVTMRTGFKLSVPVAIEGIAGFRERWTQDDIKAAGVLNMALIAWPNIVFDLRVPVTRRGRPVTTIAHCLDDPAAFRAFVAGAMARAPGDRE